jgi:hypothetical protein
MDPETTKPERPAGPPTSWASSRSRRAVKTSGSEGKAMSVLRAVTYVLASLASLLFIALVIYGAIQLNRLGNALENFASGFPGLGSSSTGTTPALPSGSENYIGYRLTPNELDAYCPEVPDDPTCALR